MKRISLLLFVTGHTIAVFAQTGPNLDSLKQVLRNQKDDSTKIETLSALCWGYNFYKPDSADFYAQQAYELAKKNKLKGCRRAWVSFFVGQPVCKRKLLQSH